MDPIQTTWVKKTGSPTTLLMPLPDFDFDITEASIPWKFLGSRGWKIEFSTEKGSVAQGDLRKQKGLLPGLLSASKPARAAFTEMVQDAAFQHPLPTNAIDAGRYAAIILPGGDAPRMRQYLESELLRNKVLDFWKQHKLVAAICHGTLVLARTLDPLTGHSILYGHRVTALPKLLDRFAYRLDKMIIRHGYIMYPKCVSEEVRACLASPKDLLMGPGITKPFAVSEGDFITARWYLDAEVFAEKIAEALEQRLRADRYGG
jgi:putative intracellular protease/amidase